MFAARVFRRGDFLAFGKQILASKEASYKFGDVDATEQSRRALRISLREKSSHRHGFGDAADGENIRGGAGVDVKFAH